jgi:serine/threonine protein kinase
LAAVHEQNLVHRDIKPTNIMVRLKDGGAATVKIIDLGLAKPVNELGSQTAISMPGGFAGTPEFASPEQFAGVGVNWFGEGPELSVLRMLGLFDRPAVEKALGALLKPPAIRDLTESLTDFSPTEWRTLLAKLRRAKLIAGEDPHHPGDFDTHPLVREYFGEQLQSQRTETWKECNRRLYDYYRTLAPHLPDSFKEMEPLFLAVICGCNAGLFREALHEVYIPRIQRGDASFAADFLGARGALLSVLASFFEHGHWGSPVATK